MLLYQWRRHLIHPSSLWLPEACILFTRVFYQFVSIQRKVEERNEKLINDATTITYRIGIPSLSKFLLKRNLLSPFAALFTQHCDFS